MNYQELVEQIVFEVLEEYFKDKEKQQNNDIVKTAEVPKPLSPMEKARALLQKTDSKYQSYIAKKLLPSLNK